MTDIAPTLDKAFVDIVGENNVITDPGRMAGYIAEPRGLFTRPAALVVRPGSTAETAAIMRLANETGTPVVPQGGNTGLVGGQMPTRDGTEIVLSLSRLNSVRKVDAAGGYMIAEAGVTLAGVQEAADEAGSLFPLTLASEGTCQIGGNISSNAGGTAVLAYGNTRDLVLGLEVVLADGSVWEGLRTLRKDNTGYDLKHLFIGAEGTLGIVTAAALKLVPKPKGIGVAFCGLSSPEDALALLGHARGAAAAGLTAFELMPRIALDLVLKHAPGARDPLAEPHPWYVLLEVSSSRSEEEATSTVEEIFQLGFDDDLVRDAVAATTLEQAQALWQIRHDISAVQGREGGSIKHDVSVAVSDVPALITRGSAAVSKLIPGVRPVPFGHVGDGNIHFNFNQPVDMDKQAFLDRWDEVNDVIHALVADYDGSIAAEHGVGQLKRKLLPGVKGTVEMDLMHRIKAAFDPGNILNPGKIL